MLWGCNKVIEGRFLVSQLTPHNRRLVRLFMVRIAIQRLPRTTVESVLEPVLPELGPIDIGLRDSVERERRHGEEELDAEKSDHALGRPPCSSNHCRYLKRACNIVFQRERRGDGEVCFPVWPKKGVNRSRTRGMNEKAVQYKIEEKETRRPSETGNERPLVE